MDKKAVWKEFWRARMDAVIKWWNDDENGLVSFLVFIWMYGGFLFSMILFVIYSIVPDSPTSLLVIPLIWFSSLILFLICMFIELTKKAWNDAIESVNKSEDQQKRTNPTQKIKKSFAEIYAEIIEASNNLLAEKAALENDIDSDDYRRYLNLHKKGFYRIKKAYDAAQMSNKLDYLTQMAERINKYKERYSCPFVGRAKVIDICDKYGLVMGCPNDFTGEVPVKNIDEINSINLADDDSYWGFQSDFVSKKEYDEMLLKYPDEYFGGKIVRIKIIAKPECFDLANKKVNPIYEIVGEDPIVLQELIGGYLVISHWE